MATRKQKAAIHILVENNGKSVSGAMREAGYPPTTAKNPKVLTESKTYKEFFKETFTPKYLREQHQKLLNLKQLATIDIDPEVIEKDIKAIIEAEGFGFLRIGKWSEFRGKYEIKKAKLYFTIPDGSSKKAAMDMAYKLTGDYAPEKVTVDDGLPATDDELDEVIQRHQSIADRAKMFKKTKSGRRPKGSNEITNQN